MGSSLVSGSGGAVVDDVEEEETGLPGRGVVVVVVLEVTEMEVSSGGGGVDDVTGGGGVVELVLGVVTGASDVDGAGGSSAGSEAELGGASPPSSCLRWRALSCRASLGLTNVASATEAADSPKTNS